MNICLLLIYNNITLFSRFLLNFLSCYNYVFHYIYQIQSKKCPTPEKTYWTLTFTQLFTFSARPIDTLTNLVLIHICKFFRLVCSDTCINDFLNITVKDFIQLVQCKIDSVICYTSLWKIVSTNLFGTISLQFL